MERKLEQLEPLVVEKAAVVNAEQRMCGRESGAGRGRDANKRDAENCKEMQITLFTLALGGSERGGWNRSKVLRGWETERQISLSRLLSRITTTTTTIIILILVLFYPYRWAYDLAAPK